MSQGADAKERDDCRLVCGDAVEVAHAVSLPALGSGQHEGNDYRQSALSTDNLVEANIMHLSSQGLLVIIIVGIIAGWLAGRVMDGGGFGLIGDLLVGLVGAFIGDWLLPRLGIHLGAGIVALIINAFIGAVVLLLILRLVGGGWGRRRRWG
jgi:uncharacterized membrane protein YeaQ/YmgE (transglycosylase-associated protein family)